MPGTDTLVRISDHDLWLRNLEDPKDFRPTCFPTGHWGQEQPLSSLIHIKLLPLMQKSFSPAFDAQLLYVGHVGQGHFDLKSAMRSACSLGVFFETLSMVFSNVSILHHPVMVKTTNYNF